MVPAAEPPARFLQLQLNVVESSLTLLQKHTQASRERAQCGCGAQANTKKSPNKRGKRYAGDGVEDVVAALTGSPGDKAARTARCLSCDRNEY